VRLIFNPLAERLGVGGAVTIVIKGRRSGQPRKAPVRPLLFEGARYLVSTYGEADWVRNLRAASGKGELRRGRTSRPFSAAEVPVAERPPIISAYCQTSNSFVRSYFEKLPDPSDHPIFRITSAAE
jgi:deazaflavin-dependent oxidoreductase (nitroreductase family)